MVYDYSDNTYYILINQLELHYDVITNDVDDVLRADGQIPLFHHRNRKIELFRPYPPKVYFAMLGNERLECPVQAFRGKSMHRPCIENRK